MARTDEPGDPFTPLMASLTQLFEFYITAVMVGFSNVQALELVKTVIATTMQNTPTQQGKGDGKPD
jgi:hypothetical protein